MTSLPHAGSLSAEMWRFSTSTRVWERADITTANGAGPSTRFLHVMTSVGLDLWVHGGSTGSGEGDGLMTSVSHAAFYSAELWWFSTSTRVWERVDSTAANGAGPSGRTDHVMTSVGLDLWVHGGYTVTGEGDACGTHVTLLLLPR